MIAISVILALFGLLTYYSGAIGASFFLMFLAFAFAIGKIETEVTEYDDTDERIKRNRKQIERTYFKR